MAEPRLPEWLFDRLIGRPRPAWLTLAIAALLYGAALATAHAEFGLAALFAEGRWRSRLFPPTMITYILVVSPALGRMAEEVLDAFRRLLPIGDDEFADLVHRAASIPRRNEWFAIAVGVSIGVVPTLSDAAATPVWLTAYQAVSNGLTNGLLAWVAYTSIASTRWVTTLLRQPLNFHPLDTSPFDPIGRQSLALALAFVGGISLGLLFALVQPDADLPPFFWLPNVAIGLVPVTVFYLNMYPTHRVLLAAKKRELAAVRHRVVGAYQRLLSTLEGGEDSSGNAAALDALVAYERRLATARTWPYNTEMLRTLLLSVLLPLIVTFLSSLIGLILT